MNTFRSLLLVASFAPVLAFGQTSLTIYNQDFAVVRDRVPLDLRAGDNVVSYANVTAQLEPDSVVLRDPAGKTPLQILNQNYRIDTLSQGYLLSLNEGKTLDFIIRDKDGKESTVRGKIIRSGYSPRSGDYRSPIIEVGGVLRFSLPGEPVFPALGENSIISPTLTWWLAADSPVKLDAELSYITNGLSWQASYNLIAPEKGDMLDLIGWVVLGNASGKTFANVSVKLMAGKVNRVSRGSRERYGPMASMAMMPAPPSVSERAFDEFHLYTLARPQTLHDGEVGQVEFIHATGVKAQTIYVYEGFTADNWMNNDVRYSPEYGTQASNKVSVMREFKNTHENNLGMPLPMGIMRFYRQNTADGHLEFTGEDLIDHTPVGETVMVKAGDAFDLIAERKRTNFHVAEADKNMTEEFEIKLRNRKTESVEIRVIEHLYRWFNWQITEKSDEYLKTDARTVEFRVTLKPDEEKVITYKVFYDWH